MMDYQNKIKDALDKLILDINETAQSWLKR